MVVPGFIQPKGALTPGPGTADLYGHGAGSAGGQRLEIQHQLGFRAQVYRWREIQSEPAAAGGDNLQAGVAVSWCT